MGCNKPSKNDPILNSVIWKAEYEHSNKLSETRIVVKSHLKFQVISELFMFEKKKKIDK